jgi:hypothetical protein
LLTAGNVIVLMLFPFSATASSGRRQAAQPAASAPLWSTSSWPARRGPGVGPGRGSHSVGTQSRLLSCRNPSLVVPTVYCPAGTVTAGC